MSFLNSEGVDPQALAQAITKLWGPSVGLVDEGTIAEAMRSGKAGPSTVGRVRSFLRNKTRTFGLPEENDMKKQLREQISAIWIKNCRLPGDIAAPLFRLAEHAFGLGSHDKHEQPS